MPRKRDSTKRLITVDAGATGGPATGRGTNYQLNYAVIQALEMIHRVLNTAPLERGTVILEPRNTERGQISRWDIQIDPPDTVIEAKVTPTRKDILEWVDRVRVGAMQSDQREFHLLYSRGAPPLLTSIERLSRIAHEASGEGRHFASLVDVEQIPDKTELLNHFGPHPERTLSRIRLLPVDEASLQRDVQWRLRHLVEPAGAQILQNFLFARFAAGLSGRTTFQITELIREAEASGVIFRKPVQVQPTDLHPIAHSAMYVLQSCRAGLPPHVLAEAIAVSFRDLEDSIAFYLNRGDVVAEDGIWVFNPLHSRLAHPGGHELLGQTLKLLLDFIRANKNSDVGRRHIGSAIALAKASETAKPDIVARIFITLDKLLKRTGNKRLVLEVATMAVRAAGRSSRTPLELQGEAQARICGVSWVYQRIGRLEEAATEAKKSLEQGEAIGWDRNTAFCQKCIGRLCRMQAEQAKQDGHDALFEEKIRESVQWLTKAIEKFSGMIANGPDKFGPDSAEVGDCYSLLGRTHMVAGQFGKAEQTAHEARRRITDEDSKDYMDLRILFGDLAAQRRDSELAVNHYTEALRAVGQGDAERSEIAARAWFGRGICQKRHNQVGAKRDLAKAAEVWASLDEHIYAAEAAWQLLLVENGVPVRHRALLEQLPAPIRVETIRLYNAKLSSMPKGARGQRKEVDAGYVNALIQQARENCTLKYREW